MSKAVCKRARAGDTNDTSTAKFGNPTAWRHHALFNLCEQGICGFGAIAKIVYGWREGVGL